MKINSDGRTMNKIFSYLLRMNSFHTAVLPFFLLGGCAGTHVANEKMATAPVSISRPHRISLVVTDTNPFPQDDPSPQDQSKPVGTPEDVKKVEADLRQDLTKTLAKRDLTVVASGQPSDLTLRCVITHVQKGSPIARLLIGYGAGQALLKMSITLSASEGNQSLPILSSFSTDGTTGSMPGAGIGIVSATQSTATAVNMISPVLGVPGTLKQGLGQEAQDAAERIDEQMEKVFKMEGWPYPRPQQSFWGKSHSFLRKL